MRTSEEIGIIVRRRLGGPPEMVYQVQPLIGQALSGLARKVARRDDFTELRKEIAVTAAAGVITLTDTSLLLEVLDKTSTLILNGIEAKWLPRYDDLRATLPLGVYWAALRNRKIYVKDATFGTLGTTSTTGTLDANYVPELSQLPPSLDNDLIDEVTLLARGQVEATPATIEQQNNDVAKVKLL